MVLFDKDVLLSRQFFCPKIEISKKHIKKVLHYAQKVTFGQVTKQHHFLDKIFFSEKNIRYIDKKNVGLYIKRC